MVDWVPVDSYLTRFVWDEAKYPTMSPLRGIVDGIHLRGAKIEDDLKSVVLSPSVKAEKNVRSILEGLCDISNSTYWKTEDEGGMGGFAGDADAHPYVSFTINLI